MRRRTRRNPMATAADLATFDIVDSGLGDGTVVITVGGVPKSPPFVPSTTTWGALTGKPAIVAAGATDEDARAEINAVGKGELVLNFADYGACDGVTNDTAALTSVLALLSAAGGGTLWMPPKTIALTLTAFPTFTIPENVRIECVLGATQFILTSNHASADRAFITSGGNNVTLDGASCVRGDDFPLVFFIPGAHDGFHLNRCWVDGDAAPEGEYAHGILLDATGTKSHITAKNSTFTKLGYPLLQNNAITSTCDTIVFDDCTFSQNYLDDLCFNAPNSLMKNVSVLNCRFVNNVSEVANAGFGVDFAHVAGGTIRGCSFEGYKYEPIHIEDYSTNIIVSGNWMVDCGTVGGGGVLVMTGCSDIIVSGNTFDARGNTNSLYAVLVLAAGSGSTPGGRPAIAPERIAIIDNIIQCGEHYRGIYAENIPDITVRGNQLFGAGTVAAGVWDGGNPGAAITIDGVRTVVDANIISGFRYGITGPFNTRRTMGDPGSVVGNLISNCDIGILAASPGTITISGNTMSNCVRPLIVGEAGVTAKPCSVVGNSAFNCVHRMEIGGKLILIRGYDYAVGPGAGQTIYVLNNFLKLPVGTVINFSGGGVFTLTTGVATAQPDGAFPHALVGTVTGATIGAADVGTATNLAHSTTSANNHVMVKNNLDQAAGVYA